MSNDPHMYNDQLRSSAHPAVGWEDVHFILQRDIFDQLGCLRKLSFQRVCQSWKSLLQPENWPDVLLVNEFPHLKPSVPRLKLRKARSDYPDRFCTAYEEILLEVVKKSRVLLIDFAETNGESKVSQRQLYWLVRVVVGFPGFGTKVANLEHLIVTRGRMSPRHYSKLFRSLRLDYVPGGLLRFSFISCNMVYTSDAIREPGPGDLEYMLSQCFPRPTIPKELKFDREVFGQRPMPNWSFRCATTEQDLCRQLLLMFSKLIFPYTIPQLEWLENCLKTVQTVENLALLREFDVYLLPLFYNGPNANTLVKRYCRDRIEYEFRCEIRYEYAAEDFRRVETLAASVLFFARKIFTGKLDFPLPPEPVTLCPVHTSSDICSCPSATSTDLPRNTST